MTNSGHYQNIESYCSSKKLIVRKLLVLLSLLSPAFAVSCTNREVGDPLSIPFVKEAISDTTSAVYCQVKSGCLDGVYGSISVIGPAQEALIMTEALSCCDYFDNVDGRSVPDGLPDFAGETLDLICDSANAPYEGYVAKGNENYLKELTFKNFLSALDTTYAVGQFDKNSLTRKQSSKIVILASPYSSAYGYRDIMSIVKKARPQVNVVSVCHSMFDYAVSRHGDKSSVMVWTSEDILGAGVYSAVCSDLSDDYPSMKHVTVCPDHSGTLKERILSFLDKCKATEMTEKIDAAIVDDMSLDADSLNAELGIMLDNGTDGIEVYKSLLSDGFEFIDPKHAVTAQCERYLRKENYFTHRVAYPIVNIYCTVPVSGLSSSDYDENGGFTDSFKYDRADNSDNETFLLIEAPGGFLSDSQKAYLRRYAGNIYSQYVSN